MSDWGYPTGYGRFDVSTETGITPSASANTKSAWAQVYASTPFDVAGLMLQLFTDAYNTNIFLYDIGVGGAGAEVVVIPNLLLGYYGAAGPVNLADNRPPVTIPIAIPAGSRIAVRAQSSVAEAAQVPTVLLQLLGQPFTGFGSLSRVTDYGTNTGTSLGTTLVATASSNGAFAQLTASCNDIKGLFLVNAPATLTATAAYKINVAVGAAAAEQIIMTARGIWRGAQTQGNSGMTNIPFWPCRIPAGTRLSASIDYTGATIQNTTVAVYGVD